MNYFVAMFFILVNLSRSDPEFARRNLSPDGKSQIAPLGNAN